MVPVAAAEEVVECDVDVLVAGLSQTRAGEVVGRAAQYVALLDRSRPRSRRMGSTPPVTSR
ncbi:MAG: hypothetical protein Q8L14_27425 [Myxococcales bacterium]|nr:hypothetical protein [Myxococcales bacterium]